jgi:molybdate transport system regulatory protein
VFIYALATNRSLVELDLKIGDKIVAMVNSNSVMLASGAQAMKISARNRIKGRVVSRLDGGIDSEITLDIGHGKTIDAVITQGGADEVGAEVVAVFKTSHVILAAD